MTVDEYVSKLRTQASEIESGKPLFLAVSTTVASMSKRIFTDGKNSADGQIGNYNSSDPLYIDPVVGKTGKDTFKDGKKHKTGYFESYKAFRGKIGRRTDFVNLNLTNELKLNFESGTRRISNTQYDLIVTKKINVDKVDGNEERFGTIFHTTQKEKELYLLTYKQEIINVFNQQ